MSCVDHCQSAQDVRVNAKAVLDRRRTICAPPPFQRPVLRPLPRLVRKKIESDPVVSSGVSVLEIQQAVCQIFDVAPVDFYARRRHRKLDTARNVAMVLARCLTLLSFPQIAREFGRNHSTLVRTFHRLRWLTEALRAELPMTAPLSYWVLLAHKLVHEPCAKK